MPHPFGIELLTVLGMGPLDHVAMAADLGCSAVSLGLEPLPNQDNPHGYPAWSLREDAALRRAVKAELAARGITLALAEGFAVRQGEDVAEMAADMDLFAELGALRINATDGGAEHGHALDQLAVLAEMAAARDMEFTIEFSPVLTLRTLADALGAVRHAGEGRAGVTIDTLHFFRSGGTVRQIAELDPGLIGYVQLCDAPRKGLGDYRAEARTARMIPGQGELPLREFVDALPRGLLLGLEVPLTAAAASGRTPSAYLGEIVRRTREFLV
jgi:sugar phosphate isomerase/epimerase